MHISEFNFWAKIYKKKQQYNTIYVSSVEKKSIFKNTSKKTFHFSLISVDPFLLEKKRLA
jgi:hypothetical protein